MRPPVMSAAEIGIVFMAVLPWLVGIAVAILAVTYLGRSARALERIADAAERERRTD